MPVFDGKASIAIWTGLVTHLVDITMIEFELSGRDVNFIEQETCY